MTNAILNPTETDREFAKDALREATRRNAEVKAVNDPVAFDPNATALRLEMASGQLRAAWDLVVHARAYARQVGLTSAEITAAEKEA